VIDLARMSLVLTGLVLFAGASFAVESSSIEAGADVGVEVGQLPPEYIGKTKAGDEVRVTDSRGQLLIISFWATWCAPCLKELPVLNAIQKSAGADRVRVVAVNLKEDKKRYRKALRAYSEFGITFVHDVRGATGRRFKVEGIPNMFIIDVDGRIAFHHVGYDDSALNGIVDEINSLLLKNNLY